LWILSSNVAKWLFRIAPKIVLMISAFGVYIVNTEKLRYNLKSIVNEPDFWLRALKNNKSCKNLRSSNYSLLNTLP
jgi:hypothetical protein